MRASRLVLLLASLGSLAAGLILGFRMGHRLDPPTRASGPPPPPSSATATGGPDFSAIARRATPAVVMGIISATGRSNIGIVDYEDFIQTDASINPGTSGGALVMELLRRSPAGRAGLQPGDMVVAVDGRPLDSAAQLRNELARADVGSELRLTVLRDGRRREVLLPVEEAEGGA